MLLPPDMFAIGWGVDRLVRSPVPLTIEAFPEDTRRFLMHIGLPALLCYAEGSNLMKMTFCRLSTGPTPVLGEEIIGGKLPSEWSIYWIVGDEFFCNGSAWWCINVESGCIERIDIELSHPIEFANTSVAHFASCALAAVEGTRHWSGAAEDWPSQVAALKQALAEIDPAAMASESNFWPKCLNLIDDDGGPPSVFEKGSLLEGEQALSDGPW